MKWTLLPTLQMHLWRFSDVLKGTQLAGRGGTPAPRPPVVTASPLRAWCPGSCFFLCGACHDTCVPAVWSAQHPQACCPEGPGKGRTGRLSSRASQAGLLTYCSWRGEDVSPCLTESGVPVSQPGPCLGSAALPLVWSSQS